MPSTIQRNALVGPFQVNTPFVEPEHIKNTAKGKATPNASGLSRPQIVWLQSVEQGVNASLQIVAQVPATSASPGQPGSIALAANTLYLCTGLNVWTKFVGTPF